MSLIFALAATAAANCRVEEAHYALRHAPQVRATSRHVDSGKDWPTGLAFGIHFGKTGRTYWWLPWGGSRDDRQNLASTTDVTTFGWRSPSADGGPRPLGDLEYVAADAGYNVIDALPRRGGVAPAHILLTGLGGAVWHWSTTQRDSAPKQFFDLVKCSAPHRAG